MRHWGPRPINKTYTIMICVWQSRTGDVTWSTLDGTQFALTSATQAARMVKSIRCSFPWRGAACCARCGAGEASGSCSANAVLASGGSARASGCCCCCSITVEPVTISSAGSRAAALCTLRTLLAAAAAALLHWGRHAVGNRFAATLRHKGARLCNVSTFLSHGFRHILLGGEPLACPADGPTLRHRGSGVVDVSTALS